jgi:hypothetical protein
VDDGDEWRVAGRAGASGARGGLQLIAGCDGVEVTGFAIVNPSLQSCISRRSDPDYRGSVLGIAQSGSRLARILGPLFGNALFAHSVAWLCWAAVASSENRRSESAEYSVNGSIVTSSMHSITFSRVCHNCRVPERTPSARTMTRNPNQSRNSAAILPCERPRCLLVRPRRTPSGHRR